MSRARPHARTLAAAVVVCLVAPFVAAQSTHVAWGQWGGDAAHSGATGVAPGPLDILAVMDLGASGPIDVDRGPGLAASEAGLVGFVPTTCELVAVDPGNATRTIAAVECGAGARFLGARAGVAFVCVPGPVGSGVLRAYDVTTGQEAWRADPARPELDVVGTVAGLLEGVLPFNVLHYTCSGAAITDRNVDIGFTDGRGNHTIERIRTTDGLRAWATSVPLQRFLVADALPADVPDALAPVLGLADTVGGFVPLSITTADAGLLVTGRIFDATSAGSPPAVAWLATNGTLHGAVFQEVDPQAPSESVLFPASVHAASNGIRIAQVFGEHVFIVDPARPQGHLMHVGSTTFGNARLAGAAWTPHGLVLPTETGALLLTADLGEPGRWVGHEGGTVQQIVMTGRDAWATLARDAANGTVADVVRFNVDTGASLQRLPLPFGPDEAAGLTLRMTPVQDGLLVFVPDGRAARLGIATPPPGLAIGFDPDYPPQGGTLVATPTAPPDEADATLLVAWGDGDIEEAVAGDRIAHTYRDSGEHTIVLTLLRADGTTASIAHAVQVGGTPPEAPNWLETIFSPDNQEVTFTVIGFTVSAIGVLIGIFAATRGRRRLDGELKRLERIRERGRTETLEALHELHIYRERIRGMLARGRVQDGQYAILTTHVRETLDVLRERILGGLLDRLSRPFLSAFDIALRDGRVDADEAHTLLALVDREKLPAAERRRLALLIAAWQAR